MALAPQVLLDVLSQVRSLIQWQPDHSAACGTVREAIESGELDGYLSKDDLEAAGEAVDAVLAEARSDASWRNTAYWLALSVQALTARLLKDSDRPNSWALQAAAAQRLVAASEEFGDALTTFAAARMAAEAHAHTGDRVQVATCRLKQGTTLLRLNEPALALRFLQEVATWLRQLGLVEEFASCQMSAGIAMAMLGQAAAAIPLFEEAAAILQHDHLAAYANCRMNQATALLTLRRTEAALPLFEEAVCLLEQHGAPDDFARCLGMQGTALIEAGRAAEGLERCAKACRLLADVGNETDCAKCQVNEGLALTELGRADEALPILEKAATILEAHEAHADLARCRANQAEALQKLGKTADALRFYEEAAPVLKRLGPLVDYARCRVGEALALMKLNRPLDALLLFEEAEELLQQSEMTKDLTYCRASHGVALLLLGRFAESLPKLQDALPDLRTNASPDDYVWLRSVHAEALINTGRTAEALPLLEDLALFVREFDMPIEYAQCRMRVGVALRELGQATESLVVLDEVAPLIRQFDEPKHQGLLLVNRALAVRDLGRVAEAWSLLDEALPLLQAHGHPSDYARCLMNRAVMLADASRVDEALPLLEEAIHVFENCGALVSAARCRMNLAVGLAELGQEAESLALLEDLRFACWGIGLPATDVLWRVLCNIAHFRDRAGATAGADRAIYDAMMVIETALSAHPARTKDRLFQRDTFVDAYRRGVFSSLRQREYAASFVRTQMAKGRTLLDLLENVYSVMPSLRDPRLAELEAREWSLIGLFDQGGGVASQAFTSALEEVRAERTTYLEELRQNEPERALLQSGVLRSPPILAEMLRSDEALIDFLDLEPFGVVVAYLVLPDQGPIAMAMLDRARIDAALVAWEGALALVALRKNSSWTDEGLVDAYELSLGDDDDGLYGLILRDILGQLGTTSIKHLVLSPSGLLHRVPFAALWHEDAQGNRRWLSEEYTLSLTPTATSLWLIRQREAETGPPHLLAVAPFADSGPHPTVDALAPGGSQLENAAMQANDQSRLPGTATEMTEVAHLVRQAGGGVVTLAGPAATRLAVTGRVGGARLILAATHGVRTAKAGEPLQAGLAFADADLRVLDIFGGAFPLLGVTQVALTACDLGQVAAVGDGALGFAQAFISAGARVVLAPLWAVDDAATCALSVEHHRALLDARRPTVAEAWQIAMATIRVHPRWMHPYYWAAFLPMGDGAVALGTPQ